MSISKSIPYYTELSIRPPQTVADYSKEKQEAREMIEFLEEHYPNDKKGIERYESRLDYLQYFTDTILIIDAIACEVNSEMWEKKND